METDNDANEREIASEGQQGQVDHGTTTPKDITENIDTVTPNSKLRISDLRLSQNFLEQAPTVEVLTQVTVRKPKKHEFVRTHKDFQDNFLVVSLDDDRHHLVAPHTRHEVSGEARAVRLVVTVNTQGGLFVWPIGLPAPDGSHNPWHRSALQAAELAQDKWVRIIADRNSGYYRVYVAQGDLGEPRWPDHTFQEIVEVAFHGDVVDNANHPVIRRLRGLE